MIPMHLKAQASRVRSASDLESLVADTVAWQKEQLDQYSAGVITQAIIGYGGFVLGGTVNGGSSGFSASLSELQMIDMIGIHKAPFRIICYGDMIYPQYENRFEKTITKDVWEYLRGIVREKLQASHNVHPDVYQHWVNIDNNIVPFGYIILDHH